MSADEHLNGQQFLHYTNAKLGPGDLLLPAAERGHKSQHRDVPDYSPNHVYLAHPDHDPVVYEQFGRHSYAVAPIGKVEQDPEYLHGGHESAQHSYRAPRAKVIRQID